MYYSEEGLIGTYRGTAIYKVTKEQYIKEKYYDNPNDMFIIDDLIIVNNLVIGKFDAHRQIIVELPITEVRSYYTRTPSFVIIEAPIKEDKSDIMVATGWESADDILNNVYKIGALPSAIPGCPDFALLMTSITVERIQPIFNSS